MALITASPTARTQALYELIRAESGNRILLAQQECPGRHHHDLEMEHLQKVTGTLPAIRGMDYIHNDFAGVNERALRWNERGGIVSICWHTGVEGIGYPESQQETPDITRLVTPGTPEHDQLLRRWDEAARALLQLQEQDVPVLWRPFHEFDGGWFWWGKQGGDAFIALWQMMVRTFRDAYGLRNLIWVLGYADDVKPGWYPGDGYADILGSDTYRGRTTHAASYRLLRALNTEKPLAFHETGLLPEVEEFFSGGAPWSWVMPWHTRWLTENNDPELLKRWYCHERTITLDSVPRF